MEIFENINIEKEKQRRINKFNYWNKRLNGNLILKENEVPFSYLYFANNMQKADNLVKELETEEIFVFRYWNNMPDKFPEKFLYTNLVSINL